MNTRSKIFWLIWLLIVISVIWWFACQVANGAVPPRPWEKPKLRKTVGVKAGDGALLLISKTMAVIPPKPILVRYYFAATASNIFGESDFSNEVIFTNVFRSGTNQISLEWDRSEGADFYRIYKGLSNRNYTVSYPAGTNLMLTVPLAWPVRTNFVIIVTSENATNLQWAIAIGSPWHLYGATNYTVTNPSPRIWRALGISPTRIGKVFVSGRWQ